MDGIIDASAILNVPEVAGTWPERARGVWEKFAKPDFRDGTPLERIVEDMDEAGVATMIFSATTPSLDRVHRSCPLRLAREAAERYPGRFAARLAVDPREGSAELRRFEDAVRDDAVVGLALFPYVFNLPPNANVYYPFYAKCEELGVPVWTQVGHTGADYPSEPGRPGYLDEVALYFPELRIVGGHIGWPWTEEMLALAWKHRHVYIDVSAHAPRYWPTSLVEFLNGRGTEKVLFATNYPMLSYGRTLSELEALPLTDQAREYLLGRTARAVYTRVPAG